MDVALRPPNSIIRSLAQMEDSHDVALTSMHAAEDTQIQMLISP